MADKTSFLWISFHEPLPVIKDTGSKAHSKVKGISVCFNHEIIGDFHFARAFVSEFLQCTPKKEKSSINVGLWPGTV